MRALALALWAAIGFCGAARAAEDRFDENIARAATEIVAARMGALRGGFEAGDQSAPMTEAEPARTGRFATKRVSRPAVVWDRGLARAVERKSAASPEF